MVTGKCDQKKFSESVQMFHQTEKCFKPVVQGKFTYLKEAKYQKSMHRLEIRNERITAEKSKYKSHTKIPVQKNNV